MAVPVIRHNYIGGYADLIIIDNDKICPSFLGIQYLLGKLTATSLNNDKLLHILGFEIGKIVSFLEVTKFGIVGYDKFPNDSASIQDMTEVSQRVVNWVR